MFVIGDISIEGGGQDPRLRLCDGQFVLEIRKRLAISEAVSIHWLMPVWVRNHLGQKQRLFLLFGNKFKFGREEARRLR